jgi:transposase
MEHYHRKHSKQRGSMKLQQVAGNELFIDYTAKKLEIVDAPTGEVTAVEGFRCYNALQPIHLCRGLFESKKEDLIKCTENALRFFGGVPKAIVSDNLKSAVKKSKSIRSRSEPKLQGFCTAL